MHSTLWGHMDMFPWPCPVWFYNIQFASPNLKVEFEYNKLTESNFKFRDPEAVGSFINSLSLYQQSLLRSFTFEIFKPSNVIPEAGDWMAVCDRLPRNLTSLHFECDYWHESGGKMDEQWIICDSGLPALHRSFRRSTTLVEIMAMRARRCAARVKIGLWACSEEWVGWKAPLHEGFLLYVLDKPEPWSKNWLASMEEAVKLDLEDGGEASSVS